LDFSFLLSHSSRKLHLAQWPSLRRKTYSTKLLSLVNSQASTSLLYRAGIERAPRNTVVPKYHPSENL
jgi:hypothetical protein